jgi:magnesium and cobalt exporter, CNNM family
VIGVFTGALLLLLAIGSMLLATVEAAFYLVRRRRLGHLTLQNPRAELANRYLDDPPTLLMPAHMGTYTAHVGMTIVLTSVFVDLLSHWALLAAFATMMGYLLLFRLAVPYALVRRSPERTLLLLLPVFHAYAQALSPLVRALRRRAALDVSPDSGEQPLHPPPPPVRDPDEAHLQDSLQRFSETLVREVMTPRPDVVAIAASSSVEELRRLMRETKYSRIPVYGENLDDVVGVVEVRDVLAYEEDPASPLQPLVRPVHLVPETKKIAELLRELQAQRTTFAVAIDEYGGTAGLVSVEDIVEELVGEIKDEYDVEAEPISVEADGAVLVSGRVSLDRLEQTLETSLAEPGEVETVGGLVSSVFGRIPRPGERTQHRGFEVEVVDGERKRVNRVRFRRLAVEQPAHDAG